MSLIPAPRSGTVRLVVCVGYETTEDEAGAGAAGCVRASAGRWSVSGVCRFDGPWFPGGGDKKGRPLAWAARVSEKGARSAKRRQENRQAVEQQEKNEEPSAGGRQPQDHKTAGARRQGGTEGGEGDPGIASSSSRREARGRSIPHRVVPKGALLYTYTCVVD